MIKVLDDLRAQVEILHWVKERQAELKELEEQAKSAIQDAMGDADTGVVDGEVVVTWKGYKRNAFDQKAFQEAHPELFEEFKTVKPYRRFEVL